MASNSFGNIFKFTSWGESHGKAIGVVIDGCPAGIPLDPSDINSALMLRSPGRTPYTSPRKEPDKAEILSGTFEGKTTGAPISIMIANKDADSSQYESIKDLLRPGHANYTYLEKFGLFDYRGGGRSSGRETACRVAAGAIAKKILIHFDIQVLAYIKQIGHIQAVIDSEDFATLRSLTLSDPLFCPDLLASKNMVALIEQTKAEGDSLGGIVECIVPSLPAGLGDPIYQKLEANLAFAMMSIPASKGFEIGSGFNCVTMKGSEHNDEFIKKGQAIRTKTNYSGGVLGGISTGMPLVIRTAFKPTSSIMLAQNTLNNQRVEASFQMPKGSRHDPCLAIRAVPVVESMTALVLVDALLLNRCSK